MHESEKWKWSRSVLSDPQRSHGLQPTRLLRPWDFPGKSTGVECHCLLYLGHPRNTLMLGFLHSLFSLCLPRPICLHVWANLVLLRFVLLHFAVQYRVLFCLLFLQIKVGRNPTMSLSAAFFCQHLFTLCFRVTFLLFSKYFIFLLLLHLLWWCVISDLWCYCCRKIMTCWKLRW